MEENAGRTNLNMSISKTFSFWTFIPRLLYILRTLSITKEWKMKMKNTFKCVQFCPDCFTATLVLLRAISQCCCYRMSSLWAVSIVPRLVLLMCNGDWRALLIELLIVYRRCWYTAGRVKCRTGAKSQKPIDFLSEENAL